MHWPTASPAPGTRSQQRGWMLKMMKFQSNSGCLMVIMFSLNRAAVFFMQLFHMRMVFAGTSIHESRNMLAIRGGPVVLTCNISKSNQTNISWTNGRFKFARGNLDTPPSSNFSTKRVRIDPEMPTDLTIFNAHDDDEGIYKCEITDREGINSITWNVTVSENHEGIVLSKYIGFFLPVAVGLLLCCITSAVFFYMKLCKTTKNQDFQEGRTQSCAVYRVRQGVEVDLSQPKSFAIWRVTDETKDSSM
ncbi:uncharacterized protein ACNS7B_024656 isoform 1-T1 [Menidia menidia]